MKMAREYACSRVPDVDTLPLFVRDGASLPEGVSAAALP